MVQWLRHYAFNAGGTGSIPGQVVKIPQATQHGQKKKKILCKHFYIKLAQNIQLLKWSLNKLLPYY